MVDRSDSDTLLTYDDALEVLGKLIEVAKARGERLGTPIVLVGGSAMAAWHIRKHSRDVDVYIPSISTDVVETVERDLRARYGPAFRLDVTTGENLWGSILVRDIAASPLVGHLEGGDYELRALRVEDLFLLKLASGRMHDMADLELLAPRTTPANLVLRWNELAEWHGDRRAILGYADALLTQLAQRYGVDPLSFVDRLRVTEGVRKALREAHGASDGDDGPG